MNIVQFDEDVNAEHLETACRNEGKVTPLRFPEHFRGKKDFQVVPHLINRGNLIITGDRRFVEQWGVYISETHGGVVIVLDDDGVRRDFTTHSAQKILQRFKDAFCGWERMSWNNSIMWLQPSFLTVKHFRGMELISDALIDRRRRGWGRTLAKHLLRNARRKPSCDDGLGYLP